MVTDRLNRCLSSGQCGNACDRPEIVPDELNDSNLGTSQNHDVTQVDKEVETGGVRDYLRDRAFRRFAGTPLRLLDTGFFVLAASNKFRMPCSNSSTALSSAPSCPTRTIATDMCKSNDGGRNTLTELRELLLAIKRAGSNPSPYPA